MQQDRITRALDRRFRGFYGSEIVALAMILGSIVAAILIMVAS